MTLSIAGKTAIVTGAANGIGLAIAQHFVQQGARVMLADIDEARLAEEVGDGGGEDGASMRSFAGNLCERLTLANLLSATIDAFERIDILVNASRQVLPSDPLNIDDGSVETMLQQNLLTSLRLSQLVAARMLIQSKTATSGTGVRCIGSIVNISSIAGCRTRPGLLAYSISAAAIDQMTRALAVSLARHHIRVNAVSFGSMMSTNVKATLKRDPARRDAIIANTPLGRVAEASEITGAVQYLCSPGADFVTGQILTVDGGRTLLDPVSAPSY